MPDIRRPSNPVRPMPENMHEMSMSHPVHHHDDQRRLWPWITGGIVIVIICAVVIMKLITGSVLGLWQSSSGEWQAVFLSNNTVYFGHAQDRSGWIVLRDIYYLQRAQTPQPSDNQGTDQTGLVLIKLGNELHGPEDYMRINKSQVIFVENLRRDSQVVKAIDKYLLEQKAQ